MSAVNDSNLITSAQVKKQIKSVQTENVEVKNSLLEAVSEFQCLDNVAKSTGLVGKDFSFASKVTWDSVISKLETSGNDGSTNEVISIDHILETLEDSSDQVNNKAIPALQQSRNKWMFQVVMIELVVLILIGLSIGAVTFFQGLWTMQEFSFPIHTFLYERPVFLALAGSLSLIAFFVMHFSVRKYIALRLASDLAADASEFDLSTALLKNTRIQHSIFRPNIVGLSWFNRKCRLKKSA